MTAYEIPLTPVGQKFSVTLAQITYNLKVAWCNAPTGGWVLDILDSDDNPVLCGVPLVTGADLLEQYGYLEFGGTMEVQTDGDLTAIPTYQNLGVQSHLYFFTDDGTQ